MSYFIKRQWLSSLGTDFKWLALMLGLGILCMMTDSTFLSESFLEGHYSWRAGVRNIEIPSSME